MSLFLSMCQILVTKTEGIYFILQSIDEAKPRRRKHEEPSEYPELELMTPGFVHEPLKHTFITFKELLCLDSWLREKLSGSETSGSLINRASQATFKNCKTEHQNIPNETALEILPNFYST